MRMRKAWILVPVAIAAFCFVFLSRVSIKSALRFTKEELALQTCTTCIENQPANDTDCPRGELVYEKFCVQTLYQDEIKADDFPVSITMCTQGTIEFLYHVPVLCHRWSGPISVAVYSPPEDFQESLELVDHLRQCDVCVYQYVRWHFFQYKNQSVHITYDTPPVNCSSISPTNWPKKRKSQGPYPINAARNIARSRALTPYVFSNDIELYPSANIIPKFERMLMTEDVTKQKQVWALPVFEVFNKYRAPLTKIHLREMFYKKQAISFHLYRCPECHKIINLKQWMDYGNQSESEESLEELRTWQTVKRERKFNLQYWEPFFIGTKDEPEFDIDLSWEGKENKMQVAYEMCLKNYSFHIVENAFLVHSPGINVYNASKESFRLQYMAENRRRIIAIKKNLHKVYTKNRNC